MRISTSLLSTSVRSTVSASANEPIVVTLRGRPVSIMVGVDPDTVERGGDEALADILEGWANSLRSGSSR